MTKYKDIIGTDIQVVTSDPTEVTGQVWYNESEGELKTRNQFVGNAWSSGGDLNTARNQFFSAGVSQTAALAAGGDYGGSPEYYDGTELYDGSSWTEVNNLNTAKRNGAGVGTQTAALAVAGGAGPSLTEVESWDGTSWTEITDINTARQHLSGAGTQTSALVFGGVNPPPTVKSETESWNGSSWTEVSDLNTGRGQFTGFGADNTSALAAGGSPDRAQTESWNGSAWYEVNDLNTGRRNLAGSGGVPSGLGFGGETSTVDLISNTELWNGTSWSETNDLSTARQNAKGAGPTSSNTSSLCSGGNNPGFTGATEEWNADIAVGAWITGANMNTARYALASANKGTRTSALVFSGGFPNKNETENYNGTAWAEVNNLNTARRAGAGAGTATSALCFSGDTGPPNPGITTNTESWNGYVWTEVNNMNTGRGALSGVGADNTSALAFGGNSGANVSETWNGSSWSEGNDLNQERDETTGSGIATAALAIGGRSQPSNGPSLALVELYNGTSWTEVGDLNQAKNALASGGSSTSAIAMGGRGDPAGAPPPGVHSSSETWNGTSWINNQDINVARQDTRGAGSSSTNAILMGGRNPATPVNYANTEEWFGDGDVTEKISSS